MTVTLKAGAGFVVVGLVTWRGKWLRITVVDQFGQAIGDVYDGLRRQRHHKPALPHNQVVRQIVEGSPGQFDPFLLRAFAACERDFERVFQEMAD